ncbi:MAG: ATP-binding protein [Proteocatella sp.]
MQNIEYMYQRKRDKKEAELENRKHIIYTENPELEDMDRDVKLLNLDLTRHIVLGNMQSREKIQKELDEAKLKRKRYMEEHEISPQDLKMKYECEACKDRGYVERMGNFQKCACLKKLQEQLRYRKSNLRKRVEKENFKTFKIDIFDNMTKYPISPEMKIDKNPREQMEAILKESLTFIDNFDSEETKSLLFYGGVGLGKSFMCSAIAKEIMDRGKSVVYYTANELIEMMQMYTFDKANFFKEYIIEDYRDLDDVDLLIIDDLGAELTNSFVKTSLFNIINTRIIKGKKLLISTNLTPMELKERYDERIFSRIIMYVDAYKFVGEDLRW